MNIVATPSGNSWHIYNGAVFHNNHKVASIVLGMLEGSPALLIVCDEHTENLEWVPLDQPKLLDLVFQVVSRMTGEWYQIDTTNMIDTTVKHIWYDIVNTWYYFGDETSSANGPFRTQALAEHNLGLYVKHMLG